LPVVATLEDLDEASLKKILTDPKNALVPAAVRDGEHRAHRRRRSAGAAGRKAIELKTGARGLRSILERILLEAMFDLPGLEGVLA
jgi:ATP-dependent Clp protease ATP-binding subunit ClpX